RDRARSDGRRRRDDPPRRPPGRGLLRRGLRGGHEGRAALAHGHRVAGDVPRAPGEAEDAQSDPLMDYQGRAILVTGGAGFIGSHLVDVLVDRKPRAIHVVDNLFLGKEENLRDARSRFPSLQFHKMDATDGAALRRLLREQRVDTVFNLATKALGYSFDDPGDAFHVNTVIAGHLLEGLRLKEIEVLVQFSSSEAYGTAQT